MADYRGELADRLSPDVPAEVATIARDTLGSAVAVAGQLPDELGGTLVETAREAFVRGMQLTSAIAAVVAVGLAILALVLLRDRAAGSFEAEAEAEAEADPELDAAFAERGGRLQRADR